MTATKAKTAKFIGVDKTTGERMMPHATLEAARREMQKYGFPARQIAVHEFTWNGEAWAVGARVFG